MPVVKYNTSELDLLARLMRSEALGEGTLGMLMVGNTGTNRVLANCLDFTDITSVTQMVYQNPGGFSGIDSSLFYKGSTTKEKELAKRVLKGETYYPATNSLWFYAPAPGEPCREQWFGQYNTGRYKGHCFYGPVPGACPNLY